jgi:hypothetical protein
LGLYCEQQRGCVEAKKACKCDWETGRQSFISLQVGEMFVLRVFNELAVAWMLEHVPGQIEKSRAIT